MKDQVNSHDLQIKFLNHKKLMPFPFNPLLLLLISLLSGSVQSGSEPTRKAI